jgi:N6-adenosine-specific RNA methylase IME4
MVWERDEKG